MKKFVSRAAILVLLGTGLASAHPHFNKTITLKLPDGPDVTLTYQTVPSNEMHTQQAPVGSFLTPRGPLLALSAELNVGSLTVPAGEYTVGVIKNSDNDWTMALYPGKIARGVSPDMARMIKLESMFSTSNGTAEHLQIDVTPGHGKFEGRAVLTIHFGALFLAGALT